jgi:hypothetical protein
MCRVVNGRIRGRGCVHEAGASGLLRTMGSCSGSSAREYRGIGRAPKDGMPRVRVRGVRRQRGPARAVWE